MSCTAAAASERFLIWITGRMFFAAARASISSISTVPPMRDPASETDLPTRACPTERCSHVSTMIAKRWNRNVHIPGSCSSGSPQRTRVPSGLKSLKNRLSTGRSVWKEVQMIKSNVRDHLAIVALVSEVMMKFSGCIDGDGE